MPICTTYGALVKSQPTSPPDWIVFRAGPYAARLPFDDTPDNLWRYVLDITAMGFRADRIGNEIVITGRPSNCFGGHAS